MNRLVLNKVVLILSTLSALIGIGFLFWILITLTYKGMAGLSFSLFTKDLVEGGIRNLLVGQFTMALMATVIAVPLGVMAGIYLREYGEESKMTSIIRNLSDVMTSAPSIVIGVFVFALLVEPFGTFNGWAGVVALAIMMVPIIIGTTDNMLALVPKELREAGIALGGSKKQVILKIVLKAAKVGVIKDSLNINRCTLNAFDAILEMLQPFDDKDKIQALATKIEVEYSKTDDIYSLLEKELIQKMGSSHTVAEEYFNLLKYIRKNLKIIDRLESISSRIIFARMGGKL